jgi:hypothetical protein
MQNRFATTVFVWSFTGFAMTAALFLPGRLNATGPTNILPSLAQPINISTDRIELSLKLKDQPDDTSSSISIDPGVSPMFHLEAKNKTGVELTIPVKLSMTSMVRASLASRVPPMPKEIWSYQRDLVLAPGQADSVDITGDVKMAAGSSISVAMTAGDQTVYPLRLAVKSAGTK